MGWVVEGKQDYRQGKNKARDATPFKLHAVKLPQAGEVGFIYIAYPEGGRPTIADARTREILDAMERSWHKWTIRVPVTVISRLYPRPVGVGCPDMIENALPGVGRGREYWLTMLPWTIFTRQFE